MKRDPAEGIALSLPSEQVELALAGIEASAAFRTSLRHRTLLRHLVARLLAGDLASLKETMIAVEVFDRPVASFDPKTDTIVRVEARRLRGRLARYYAAEGRDAPFRIELPIGSYVPLVADRIAPDEEDAATRRARELAERGEHFLREALSRDSLDKALARFDEAIRAAPGYAPAYVGLARAWFNLGTGWHQPPAIAFAHAAEALRHALALDASNAVAHTLLGALQHQLEHDWAAAERSFRRAVSLAPQNAFVHSAYGAHLYLHGDFSGAERELAAARRIDPLYVNSRAHLINLLIVQGRIDEAEAAIGALRDIAPDSLAGNGLAAVVAAVRGDTATAVRLYEALCARHPDHPGCFLALAAARAMAGDIAGADTLQAETLQRFADRAISPYVLAMVATRAKRRDLAFTLLAQAIAERDPTALEMRFDVSFADLFGDARWPELVGRLPPPAARRRVATAA